ncbi:hypothetical protein GCM10009854_06270 [Saccharopolyspora halophila]|uniref:YggT family protein n=1 Tax=Saccharopolyspora halophila TaxID=405551 RepID=A0ABN3FMS5_9PSEU
MNYDPRQGPPPQQGYSPHPPNHPGYYEGPPPDQRRDDGAETIANIVRVVVGVVVAIFALHVLFVVLDANQGNGFVSLIYTLAQTFVLGLGDVFTPGDELLGVVLNYALAALVWAVGGQLIIKALRRR